MRQTVNTFHPGYKCSFCGLPDAAHDKDTQACPAHWIHPVDNSAYGSETAVSIREFHDRTDSISLRITDDYSGSSTTIHLERTELQKLVIALKKQHLRLAAMHCEGHRWMEDENRWEPCTDHGIDCPNSKNQ